MLFEDPSGPYETAAEQYRDAGLSPIVLPPKAKWPPVEGCTGEKHRGVYVVTDADIRFQAGQKPGGNVGVRLPEFIVGIDVDVRNAGDTTIAVRQIDLGDLPPTMYGTSRDDGSRIAFYRVPAGLHWKDVGDGVETIWWGSRYAVSWPSLHPDTGEVYRWFTADDVCLDGVPEDGWVGAADLPDAWVEALQQTQHETVAAEDLPEIRPAEARVRINGVLNWLKKADRGERNNRIFDAGVLLGGLLAQLPEDCTDEELTEESVKAFVRDKVFPKIDVDPKERKAGDTLDRGWDAGARNPAANPPPDFAAVPDEGPGKPKEAPRLRLEVTNPDKAYKDACRVLGTGSLSGIFRRDDSLIFTPRIGEKGYVPLSDGKHVKADGTVVFDEDGPAQVDRLDETGLRVYMSHRASLYKKVTPRNANVAVERDALLPPEVATMLVKKPKMVTGARVLRGVTHTPLVLADGTVLREPGYHAASGVLFLPTIDVPLPDGPVTREQVRDALALLHTMLKGFPFDTAHDRATYYAALVTPLLRQILSSGSKGYVPLIAIGAPAPGSGKSNLAWILRELFGGVFRAEMPREEAELGKQLVAILDRTTAPVVQFDNLRGTFRSAKFEGLMTTEMYSDRLLGGHEWGTWANDRLWVVTGNNLRFAGDMRRRLRWVTIDSKMARPEKRKFDIDLKPWVAERRAALLGALLTLVIGWTEAGAPMPEADTSDDFGRWTQVTQGLLTWAGVEGTVGGATRDDGLEEADDAHVLDLLAQDWGRGSRARRFTAGEAVNAATGDLWDLMPRPARGGDPNAKSLGWWLRSWENRPTESGVVLRKTDGRYHFEHALAPEDQDLL